jgi:hypothetical protein
MFLLNQALNVGVLGTCLQFGGLEFPAPQAAIL